MNKQDSQNSEEYSDSGLLQVPITCRYAIYKGSQSQHCCFDFTVVDTTKPTIINGIHFKWSDGQYQYEAICECFFIEDAERICSALNAQLVPRTIESLS